MKIWLKMICTALAMVSLYGCGSGGGNNDAAFTDSTVLPAGRAILTFSAVSSARLAAPISGIDLSLTLPTGMSVATVGGVSGHIENVSVLPGSDLVGTNLAFGTYSASNGKTRLTMDTTSDRYRSGEFLRLTCNVASNSGITLGNLKTRLSLVKAVGWDPLAQTTVTLTDRVRLTLGIGR